MTSDSLMQAILAMDAYNQGYNKGLNHNQSQIGLATVGQDSLVLNTDPNDPNRLDQAAGFYAVAYNYDGQTVISYRGTDQNFVWPWDDTGSDLWNGYGVAAGFPTGEQARLAAEFYQAVTGTQNSSPLEGTDLLVGHSLGGGTTSMHRELAA